MIPKLIKIPEALLLEISDHARRRAKETSEPVNVSRSIRELLRIGLDMEATSAKHRTSPSHPE